MGPRRHRPARARPPAPVGDDGGPGPTSRTFLVPMAETARWSMNWFVAGLSGSGSKQIRVDAAFVPEYRTHRFLDVRSGLSPGLEANPAALFSYLRQSVLLRDRCSDHRHRPRDVRGRCVAAGREHARSAFDRGRPEDILLELRIASTAARLDAATLQLRHNFAMMTASIERGDPIRVDTRSRCRRMPRTPRRWRPSASAGPSGRPVAGQSPCRIRCSAPSGMPRDAGARVRQPRTTPGRSWAAPSSDCRTASS